MKPPVRAIAVALAVLLSCGACVAASDDHALTLAQTKSQVQLLRNESVVRLPSSNVASVTSTDTSEACEGNASIRRWLSSAIIDLAAEARSDPDLAMTTLAESFENDGWVVSPGNERLSDKQQVLTSGTSAAEIRLIASVDGATITVESAGPCVQTDGADSDEVQQLEQDAS